MVAPASEASTNAGIVLAPFGVRTQDIELLLDKIVVGSS